MMMKKMVGVTFTTCVLLLSGCASQPQVIEKPVVKEQKTEQQQRLDIRKTVGNLLDYCDVWAAAFEANLGKAPEDAFDECVDLTIKNMKDQSKDRKSSTSRSDITEFPFKAVNR